jgi:hypothetical protein
MVIHRQHNRNTITIMEYLLHENANLWIDSDTNNLTPYALAYGNKVFINKTILAHNIAHFKATLK